jgi:hypothetical protein
VEDGEDDVEALQEGRAGGAIWAIWPAVGEQGAGAGVGDESGAGRRAVRLGGGGAGEEGGGAGGGQPAPAAGDGDGDDLVAVAVDGVEDAPGAHQGDVVFAAASAEEDGHAELPGGHWYRPYPSVNSLT